MPRRKFYLRSFADRDSPLGQEPALWVWDIHSQQIAQRSPENLAVESGYYAIEPDQGRDYETLENELAKMEDQAAFALREMLSRPVGAKARCCRKSRRFSLGLPVGFRGSDELR